MPHPTLTGPRVWRTLPPDLRRHWLRALLLRTLLAALATGAGIALGQAADTADSHGVAWAEYCLIGAQGLVFGYAALHLFVIAVNAVKALQRDDDEDPPQNKLLMHRAM
ncbi:hypothetical protein [Streptomyces sp. MW-W600-10]|uniref:hypothetical protein n=1 Tax=Streptomyces sp. MW-W600-10 TaxID=2829819 RepID=UPI001C441BEB|nr:hypothetical protein [Streptomyces sp. MW-W600-10]MBV7249308.1 hypothetical protein [Streptomyces sp. MW-W600-10]